MDDHRKDLEASQEQALYARVMSAGMRTGLLVLVVTFALYLSGLVAPVVPIEEMPQHWSLGVDRYMDLVRREHLPGETDISGWWWITALDRGDYLNYLGIALLSAVTVVCFLAILPTLLRKRDSAYATLAAVEVLVLVLAASGILGVGH